MRASTVLITDLDNTLYDFVAYYEAGLAGLVTALSVGLGLTEDAVTARLRDVYLRRGSIEYPFAVEEVPEVCGLPQEVREPLVRASLEAFWSAASRRLTSYPTVPETLRQLAREGIAVIAHTDAPIHEVIRRLRHLELDRYLTGIVAQQWFARRPGRTLTVYLPEMPGWVRPPQRFQPLWRVPLVERKPNASIYQRIAEFLDIDPRYGTVIGDSVVRDLMPARQVGFEVVWARYGQRRGLEGLMRSVVADVLPEVGARRAIPSDTVSAVDSFEGVLRYLPAQQILTIRE